MWRKIILIIAALTLGIFFVSKLGGSITTNNSTSKVAATIFPLYDIVRNVAGTNIDVELILPPGASPHTFEPSPQEIKNLQGSTAIFSIGHEIDNWSTKLAKTAGIDKQIIVDKNIEFIEGDPHYWLSIENAKFIADQALEELISLYPQYQDQFKQNHTVYIAKLSELDADIKTQIGSKKIKIATFHEAWEYFAQEYGIQVVASFEEYPGKEPSPAYLANFQNQVLLSGVKVIYAEPQFSTAQLVPIASDLGVQISTLDPIGGIEGRDSYISLMKYNLERILQVYP